MTVPLQADPITLPVGPRTDQICPKLGAGVPVLIFNADSVNTAYVGYNKGIGTTNSTPVAPLSFVVMDGARTLYGFCPTANIILNITPGGSQQAASPAAIAAQIAAAGIPSIDVPTELAIIFQQTVAAGGTFTPPRIPVSKFQSWYAKIICTATSSGVGTDPTVRFDMAWSIAIDNFDPLIQHDWVFPTTPFNFFYNYVSQGQGPVYGDTLTLTWSNNDTQPVNVTIGLFGSYRPRTRPNYVGQYHWVTSTGAPDPTRGLGSDGIVIISNPTAGGGILPSGVAPSPPDLMNLIEGPAMVSGNIQYSAAGLAKAHIIIDPTHPLGAGSVGGFTIPISGTVSVANEAVPFTPVPIILPRSVCNLQLQNDPDSASNIQTAQIIITAQNQPQ